MFFGKKNKINQENLFENNFVNSQNTELYYETEHSTVSEASVKKQNFIIMIVPILVSIILAVASFSVQYHDFKYQRRETCLYTDDIDWEAGKAFLKADCKAEFVNEAEDGIIYKFDGIDFVYEGNTETYFLYKDNVLYGVVAHLPYSAQLMEDVIDYYHANDIGDTYVAQSGDNEVLISQKEDKINVIVRAISEGENK